MTDISKDNIGKDDTRGLGVQILVVMSGIPGMPVYGMPTSELEELPVVKARALVEECINKRTANLLRKR